MSTSITFKGCDEAEWFSKELQHSFQGVLSKNYISDRQDSLFGSVTASVDGRPWSDTIWSRDAGTFLRELVHYGCFEEAKGVLQSLLKHIDVNESGYLTFPDWVKLGERKSGDELDGTTMIIIASVLLSERLPECDPFHDTIYDFLVSAASPVRYILHTLQRSPFIAGSGEFGGGCEIEGSFYNVVQNGMSVLTLDMVGTRLKGDTPEALMLKQRCLAASRELNLRMADCFVGEAGQWHWSLNTSTCLPDYDNNIMEINRGFGGINGVLSHAADVHGFLPRALNEPWLAPSVQTFWKLLSHPKRMEQFVKYGMWTQFDDFRFGLSTGPSYGHGYALQIMLLLDRPELYTKAANWLAWATLNPGYSLERENDYWFFERYYSPELHGRHDLEEGCGALNLVNVTEPLKIARLMVGVDDSSLQPVRIVPRLPAGWTEAAVTNMPIRGADGNRTLNLLIRADKQGAVTDIQGSSASPLPELLIRLGSAERPRWRTIGEGSLSFQAHSE